jgi:hypothetical protein
MKLQQDEEKKLLNRLMGQRVQYLKQVEDKLFILFQHLFLQRQKK